MLTHYFPWGPVTYDAIAQLGLPHVNAFALAMQLTLLVGVDAVLRFQPRWALKLWERGGVRMAAYLFIAYDIVFFGVFERVDFIYFQF